MARYFGFHCVDTGSEPLPRRDEPTEPESYYLKEGCIEFNEEPRDGDEVSGIYAPGAVVYPTDDWVMARWGGDYADEALHTVWLVPVSVEKDTSRWALKSHPYRVTFRIQKDQPESCEPLVVPDE